MNGALGLADDVVQDLCPARVVGVDRIRRAADGVAADDSAAVAVEDRDRQIDVALHVVHGVVVDIERAGGAHLNAAKVNVLHGDVVNLGVVVSAGDVVGGDDAGGGVKVRAAANDA